MGSFKALCIAGIASLAAMSTAHAADLFLPPPPPVEPAYVPMEFHGGFYLRGDVGAGINTVDQKASTFAPGVVVENPQFSNVNLADSVNFGFGAGYQFNSYFRADVTAEYRTDAKYSSIQSYGPLFCAGALRCNDGYNASISSAVFLANGYVDLGTWWCLTPYVGGGVGVADVMVKGLTDNDLGGSGAFGSAADKNSAKFAFAAMAGVSYSLTHNIKLDLGYRYLNMGTVSSNAIVCNGGCTFEVQKYALASHDIRLGLRYVFDDVAPPPPAQYPIVRKY